MLFYLSIIDQSMSSILVLETNKVEKPMYFVRKVLKGSEKHYQKIEKLALVVIIIAIKIQPYFQGHIILVKTNYPIQQVLNKPYLA